MLLSLCVKVRANKDKLQYIVNCEPEGHYQELQVKDVPLRTRRALSLYKVYGDSALTVLSGTLLNSINALLVLSGRCFPGVRTISTCIYL